MDKTYIQQTIDPNDVFDDFYINPKSLYLHTFNKFPDNAYIDQIDGEKAYEVFIEKFSDRVIRTHKYRWFRSKKKGFQFGETHVVLDNNMVIEFEKNWCDIYHDGTQQEFIDTITGMVSPLRRRERREPLEINLVVQGKSGLKLKEMEIKRTKLDLELFYGEAFKETDEIIRKRLGKKNDKGIVLLHGLPGAGKTTYLRYLVGKIKKRVLFLSPSVARNLMNPDFIEIMVDNPNTVIIIEDAENIIMDRKVNQDSSVSNLLNISDGLLADFLNVQLICTFNNSLTLIDSALMRKGRLIAKYEFGKLDIAQSQRLSDHLGFQTVITKPMTLAEIANQHEKQPGLPQMETIGFKRQTIQN